MQISKEQRWREHVAAVKEFPGTIEAYCRENDISSAALNYWRKKYSGRSEKRVPTMSSFVPVEVVREAGGFGHGLPDAKWLAEFIVHLSGRVM